MEKSKTTFWVQSGKVRTLHVDEWKITAHKDDGDDIDAGYYIEAYIN